MTLRTVKIELRVDYSDPSKDDIIINAAKMAAKHLYTTATLIADSRQPQIALESGDMFSSAEEISLADDLPVAEPLSEPVPETESNLGGNGNDVSV